MALATYADLIATIGDTLNRQDLTATIPNFILLAEAQFNRTLRTRDMITRTTDLSVSSQYTSLPADYREMKSIGPLGPTATDTIEFMDERTMALKRAKQGSSTGTPRYYCVLGGEIEVLPNPDTTYVIPFRYFASIPALAPLSVNWLYTKHPDAYLYGALLQTAPYLKDDERIQVWSGYYIGIMDSIALEESRASYSGATPKVAGRRIG